MTYCLLQELLPVPDNMMEGIKFYVQECYLDATILKRISQKIYPDQEE